MYSHEEFRGVRCVVTGAAGGIGRAVCQAFQEVGADVTAVDLPESEQTTAEPPWTRFVPCDITSITSVTGLGAVLPAAVDVLVNAAGIMRKAALADTEWETWERVYAVNCRGPLQLTQLLLDRLTASPRGRVINVASMTATLGLPTYGAYSSAKAALLNASRVLGAELAATGVTVNTISPGWVATPMTEQLFTRMEQLHHLPPGEGRGYVEGLIPQHRLVEPEEIAGAVLFLASTAAGSITGHDLAIDGGLTTMFTPGVHGE